MQTGREVNVLKSIPVRDVMNTRMDTIYEGTSLIRLQEYIFLRASLAENVYFVDCNRPRAQPAVIRATNTT